MKAGDRVRVSRAAEFYQITLDSLRGACGSIVEFDHSYVFKVRLDAGEYLLFYPAELELLSPLEQLAEAAK